MQDRALIAVVVHAAHVRAVPHKIPEWIRLRDPNARTQAGSQLLESRRRVCPAGCRPGEPRMQLCRDERSATVGRAVQSFLVLALGFLHLTDDQEIVTE